MSLEEARAKIDAIDPQLKALIMERLDCSYEVAVSKAKAGETTIFRADREDAILERMGAGVEEARRAGYLSVVKKIMETSRMYQYGLLFGWMDNLYEPLVQGLTVSEADTRVRVSFKRADRPDAFSQVLGIIADYGYALEQVVSFERKAGDCICAELVLAGSLRDTHLRQLMFELSKETSDFKILESF